MNAKTLLIVALSGAMATFTFAQTTQPTLPAGHPAIPGASANPQLPPGHPQIPQQGGGSQLPAGHPDISQMKVPAKPAQFGSLMVRAYQATKNGSAIGGEKVTLELYNQGEPLQKFEGKLDKTGSYVFERLPLALPFQPLVKVTHAGIEYQAAGDLMDPYHAGERIELALYDAADKEPDWNIHMRHVMVEPTPEGLRVTEILALLNNSDRAWAGAKGSNGKTASFSVELPAGATQLQLGGFNDGAAQVKDGRVVNSAALNPGISQYQLSYLVPSKDGQAKLTVVAPGVVQHMMVLVTDTGAKIRAEGLKQSGTHDTGSGKAQVFGADGLKAGDRAVLTIVLPRSARADATGALGADSSDVAKIVAGVGGGMALAAGTGYVLLKPAAKPARAG